MEYKEYLCYDCDNKDEEFRRINANGKDKVIVGCAFKNYLRVAKMKKCKYYHKIIDYKV